MCFHLCIAFQLCYFQYINPVWLFQLRAADPSVFVCMHQISDSTVSADASTSNITGCAKLCSQNEDLLLVSFLICMMLILE